MSVEKSLEKFRKNLESGSVYEAQQLIKTVYHRLRSRKLIEESLELLEKAACLQLDHEQVTCATELASTLIQAYRDDNLAAEETAVQRILRVLTRFEACSTSSPQEYTAVAKAALKWLHNSASSSTADAAVAEIHARLGRYMFREQGLEKLGVTSAHLARSRDMQSLADVVSQAARDLAPGEPELLAVRAVLQVLNLPNCLPDEQLPLAEQLGSRLKGNGTLPKDSILAHFVNLLFEALQRKSLNLVRLLRREYEGSLKQDPELLPELDAVEAKYCGAKPPGNGLEGLLGNMLSSLGVG